MSAKTTILTTSRWLERQLAIAYHDWQYATHAAERAYDSDTTGRASATFYAAIDAADAAYRATLRDLGVSQPVDVPYHVPARVNPGP